MDVNKKVEEDVRIQETCGLRRASTAELRWQIFYIFKLSTYPVQKKKNYLLMITYGTGPYFGYIMVHGPKLALRLPI